MCACQYRFNHLLYVVGCKVMHTLCIYLLRRERRVESVEFEESGKWLLLSPGCFITMPRVHLMLNKVE